MSAFILDTHQIILRLQDSGFAPEQAQALTTELREIANSKHEGLATKEELTHLATKEDLANVKSELKEDIANVKSELKEDIANVKSELKEDIANTKISLVQWMIAIAFAQVAAVLTILSLVL